MSSTSAATPARGTRPRNRRAITLDVATDLFYRHGYAQVSMIDIAAATNVGPSALYRHFPSKADLLAAAIRAGITPYAEALSDAEGAETDPVLRLGAALRNLARAAIEHRTLGVLWQRDARNLAESEQRGLRGELRGTTDQLARLVHAARPELDGERADALAWCTMGALVSLGFHSITLPRPDFDHVMVDIVSAVTTAPLPTGAESEDSVRPAPVTASTTRRDALISVATALIADRGFAATGIDAIGDAAGIAGPSVYTHFTNKQAILAAAIQRASAILLDDLRANLESDDPAELRFARIIESYVRLANQDRSIIRALISDMDQLLPSDRELARRDQRSYVDAWVALLQEVSDLDPISARLRVQAVLLAVNDAVQTPHLRAQPGFEPTLASVAKHVLGIAVER